MTSAPTFTITNRMTQAITRIERTRGFLEAEQLSAYWVREVGEQALILETHHTTHIEGTRLTLDQAERLWKGETVPEADLEPIPDLKYIQAVGTLADSGDKDTPKSLIINSPYDMPVKHWEQDRHDRVLNVVPGRRSAGYEIVTWCRIPNYSVFHFRFILHLPL